MKPPPPHHMPVIAAPALSTAQNRFLRSIPAFVYVRAKPQRGTAFAAIRGKEGRRASANSGFEVPKAAVPRGSRGLKETTGLVGLAVDPHARESLMAASRAVLVSVAAKIPKEAQYRENVEATFRIWLNTVRRPPPCESVS